MRAAVLHEFGSPLVLEERPEPEPKGEEVLVRVRGAGVCHSDVQLADGQYPDLPLPRVLGHEISGEADGIGEVLVFAAWGCGSCSFCVRGEEQLCSEGAEAGWLRDGGYAESVLVPSKRHVVPLPPLGAASVASAAILGDAGVTPYRAVRRAQPWLEQGGAAVVLGVGGLGQFAIQYLKRLTPARVRRGEVLERLVLTP